MNTPQKILVIRNDKLGDFMLAWPAFALLKKQYPEAEITALVPQYTAPLAEQCEWIDNVLIDTKNKSFFKDVQLLSQNIKHNNFDVSISLFSELRTSLSLWLAGVKTRVGPATKIAQLFLNKTLKQKRSQSIKPEYEYNVDLIKYFIKIENDTPTDTPTPPFLSFSEIELKKIKNSLKVKLHINNSTQLVIIHPGTGGSAVNLTTQQYAELARLLAKKDVYFIITTGPNEHTIAEKLSSFIKETQHHIHYSNDGIIDFCKLISICDVFISGSTGPLHIAGALNKNTVGFYPTKQSATSLRWQTLNSAERRLSISPNTHTEFTDLSQIDMKKTADLVINKFQL